MSQRGCSKLFSPGQLVEAQGLDMYSHGETKLYYRDMYPRACILLTHIYIYIYKYIDIHTFIFNHALNPGETFDPGIDRFPNLNSEIIRPKGFCFTNNAVTRWLSSPKWQQSVMTQADVAISPRPKACGGLWRGIAWALGGGAGGSSVEGSLWVSFFQGNQGKKNSLRCPS